MLQSCIGMLPCAAAANATFVNAKVAFTSEAVPLSALMPVQAEAIGPQLLAALK